MKTSRKLVAPKGIPVLMSLAEFRPSGRRAPVYVNRTEPNHSSLADSHPGTPIMAEDAWTEHIRDLAEFWRMNTRIGV